MKLAELRKQKGLSRNELARRSGLHPTTLAFIERGIVRKPSLATVLQLCVALGVLPEEVDEFAEWVEKEKQIKVMQFFDFSRALRQQQQPAREQGEP